MSDCYVYVIKFEGTEFYKIGRTKDPKGRLSQMQTGSPVRLLPVICKQVIDGVAAESALHKLFDQSRHMGEWFCLGAGQVVLLVQAVQMLHVDFLMLDEEVDPLPEPFGARVSMPERMPGEGGRFRILGRVGQSCRQKRVGIEGCPVFGVANASILSPPNSDFFASVKGNKEGAERVLTYLFENRRGASVSVRDVAENRRNRDFGLGTTDAAREMLELMRKLGVCHSAGDDTYLVSS